MPSNGCKVRGSVLCCRLIRTSSAPSINMEGFAGATAGVELPDGTVAAAAPATSERLIIAAITTWLTPAFFRLMRSSVSSRKVAWGVELILAIITSSPKPPWLSLSTSLFVKAQGRHGSPTPRISPMDMEAWRSSPFPKAAVTGGLFRRFICLVRTARSKPYAPIISGNVDDGRARFQSAK